MHLLAASLLTLITPISGAAVLPIQQQPLPKASPNGFRIPTIHESAIMARRMMHLEGSGTISTIFPSSPSSQDPPHTLEDRPDSVAHLPFGMPEYFADCEHSTGNPTILQVDIANTFKNARAGSNVTLSISWHPPGKSEGSYSAAKMPRYALLGWLQEMDLDEEEQGRIEACFLKKHPDTIWTPDNDIHTSRWVRLVVEEFYWFGGFGDRARIQWIGVEEWKNVTREEVRKMRLPGEEDGDDLLQMEL